MQYLGREIPDIKLSAYGPSYIGFATVPNKIELALQHQYGNVSEVRNFLKINIICHHFLYS